MGCPRRSELDGSVLAPTPLGPAAVVDGDVTVPQDIEAQHGGGRSGCRAAGNDHRSREVDSRGYESMPELFRWKESAGVSSELVERQGQASRGVTTLDSPPKPGLR